MVSKSKRSWRCPYIVVLILHTKKQWHPKRRGQIMQHKLGTFQCWGANSRLQPNGFLVWNSISRCSRKENSGRDKKLSHDSFLASYVPEGSKGILLRLTLSLVKTWPPQGLYGYVLDHHDITVEPLPYTSTHFLPVCITYFIHIKPFSILHIQIAVLPSFLLLS